MPSPIDPALMARARATWPEVVLDDTTFGAFLDEAAAATGDSLPPGELDLPLLYLACACVHGEPHALAAFERQHLAAVPRLVARITSDAAIIDELVQRLRIKLFVAGEQGPPRIAYYRRGSFGAWLRVVACRAAIDLLRERAQPMVSIEERGLEQRALGGDPELALVKAKYQAHVSNAFAAALSALSATDRAMLRLCFVDDLGLEAIGKIYQLSKSAVSRRLSRCREVLLADVKRRLQHELGIAETELESLMRLVTSQLHLSLPRLLRE